MLNLEEIKASAKQDISNLEKMEHAGYISQQYAHEGAAITIKTLLAEVERMTAENNALESDKINAEMNLENLTAEVEGLNAKNATLKKALELALTDLDYHTGYSERENIIIRREAINRYIQQAQKQEGKK